MTRKSAANSVRLGASSSLDWRIAGSSSRLCKVLVAKVKLSLIRPWRTSIGVFVILQGKLVLRPTITGQGRIIQISGVGTTKSQYLISTQQLRKTLCICFALSFDKTVES